MRIRDILHALAILICGTALSSAQFIINPYSFSAAPGGSGYALVIEGSKAGAASGVTTDAADTTGATLQVVTAIYYNGTPTLADSKSNTWTGLTAYGGFSSLYNVKIYYCIGGTVGSGHTYTLSGSAYSSIVYAAFSKTSPLFDTGKDSGLTGESSFTTIQPGSLTPSVDNCLLISAVSWNQGGDASINSSFTLLDQVANIDVANFRGCAAYKIQTTATAENPTWTITNGANSGGTALAVFK